VFVKNLLSKFKFYNNCTRITGILHEEQYAFFIVPHLILLRMKNASHKRCRGSQNTHFLLSNFLPPKIVSFFRKCGKIL